MGGHGTDEIGGGSATARAPCPECGEAVPEIARRCHHCRAGLLVDVVLGRPWPEARQRYEVARLVRELLPSREFTAVRRDLEHADGPRIARLTRAEALEIETVLEDIGIGSAAIPSVGRLAGVGRSLAARARMRPWEPALLLLGAIVGMLWLSGSEPAIAPGPEAGPGAPQVEWPETSPAVAPTPPVDSASSERELVDRVIAATATVRCPRSEGSGFFVTPDLLVTNAHVLCGAGESPTVVMENGTRYQAWTEAADDWIDLALLRVQGADEPALALGDATSVRRGDRVLAIGNPHGLEFTVTDGIVSHEARPMMGIVYLQIDLNVNPGNSGGPLVDQQGRVVGIVSMKVEEASGLGLAIPINYLYGPPAPLLASRAPALSGDRWSELLAEADEADRADAEDVARVFEQPGLVAAVLGGGQLTAVVVQQSDTEPYAEPLAFRLRSENQEICALFGEARSWHAVDAIREELLDDRSRAWLERHGVVREFFASAVAIDVGVCPVEAELVGAELVLEGGDVRADRVTVAADPFALLR